MDSILLGLSLVVVLSVAARLAAIWLRVPAIVPLLIVGVLAGGSVAGLVEPDELLGESLSPVVQMAVAVILFEGALGLRREELGGGVRSAVLRLITLGVVVTWAIGTVALVLLFDMPTPVAVLIGAVLIVSGPTVVIPMLEFIRPTARVRSILKWEGVLVDPIGAIVAVLVYDAMVHDRGVAAFAPDQVALSLATGLAFGALAALALMPLLSTDRLSGRDKVAATLGLVIAAFAAADTLRDDAGLAAAIAMGLVLANQRRVHTEGISEFKETLVPILVGILFVLLAANVDLGAVVDLGLPGLALVAILILVARPLAVATTLGVPMSGRERAFLGVMAPRGIVAASTASVFGLELTQRGVEGAGMIIPITFLVVAATVLVAAATAPPLARLWGLAGATPPKVLFIGAPSWALELAAELEEAGARALVWCHDDAGHRRAAGSGLTVATGPLSAARQDEESLLEDLSAAVLASPDETLNQVLAGRLTQLLRGEHVYKVRSPADAHPIMANSATPLFDADGDVGEIERRLGEGEGFFSLPVGRPIPPDAVPVASVRFASGGRPARVLFASAERPDIERRAELMVLLGPAPGGAAPAQGDGEPT